jgi:hypothetical protein
LTDTTVFAMKKLMKRVSQDVLLRRFSVAQWQSIRLLTEGL